MKLYLLTLFPPSFFFTIFFALSHCGAVLNIYCGWIANQFLNVEILFFVANAPFIMHNIVVFFIVAVIAIKEAKGFRGHLGISMPAQDCALQKA